eukprot:TRINITY_DN7231_c0_g1_i1.p1 TRINITY_DN7231_c0_g1~~TRINITY_DN7231_c0_g1_i1.p1  ORF type:complete len:292 (-),score=97.14 TRINITY_DN7231_c0_g1_i1:5-880(-)
MPSWDDGLDEIEFSRDSPARYTPESSMLGQLERKHCSPMSEMGRTPSNSCTPNTGIPQRSFPAPMKILSPLDPTRYSFQHHIADAACEKTLDEEIDEIDLSSSDAEANSPEMMMQTPESVGITPDSSERTPEDPEESEEDASLRLALALQEEENQYAMMFGAQTVFGAAINEQQDFGGAMALEEGLSEDELASLKLCRELEEQEQQEHEDYLTEQVELQNRRLQQAQEEAGERVAARANNGEAASDGEEEDEDDEEGSVSYTHLTLPTKRIVWSSVDAVSLKKKKKDREEV